MHVLDRGTELLSIKKIFGSGSLNKTTDNEKFEIEHNCAFINELKTRIIPIQDNSHLTK